MAFRGDAITAVAGAVAAGSARRWIRDAGGTGMLQTRRGSCRCGRVTFEVDAELDYVLYQFHTRTAKHYFCGRCGVHRFARPRIDLSRWVVNVRCLDGVDVASIPVHPFGGANWEVAARAYAERLHRAPGA